MSVSKIKSELYKLIETIDDEELLRLYHQLLEREVNRGKDWWDEMDDSEKKEIERSLRQADRGELIPHNEVMKKHKKWL